MSITRNIRHKTAAATGGARKTVGRITGSRHQQSKGRSEQVKGNLSQVMARIRAAFRR